MIRRPTYTRLLACVLVTTAYARIQADEVPSRFAERVRRSGFVTDADQNAPRSPFQEISGRVRPGFQAEAQGSISDVDSDSESEAGDILVHEVVSADDCDEACDTSHGPILVPPGLALPNERGFFVRGWIDQGFTGNTSRPRNRFNLPVTFNDRANEYQMNQLYVTMGRDVDTNGCQWDIGGRVDLLYGTDYFFTTALGLETHQDGSPKWNGENGPRGTGAQLYGLAMPQAYAEVFAPVGNGLSVKMGHFYTIMGFESVMAPQNFFYSHAYTMQYGEPFTHTGVLAEYALSDDLQVQAGFTRGWDTWEDNNDKLGFLGGFRWTNDDETTSVSFALHTGNEDDAGINNRTSYSLVLQKELSCCWSYIFQHDFGVEANAEVNNAGGLDSAKWYGINQYLIYHVSSKLDAGLRLEWFRDQDNARVLGIPIESQVRGGNYVGITAGLNWRPMEQFTVRPEIRWDHSDVEAPALGIAGMFDDRNKTNQFLVGLDAIYAF